MTDDYTKLARCMDCEPHEVSGLIQQHAPWNGKSVCDDALRERLAVVAYLRAEANAPHPIEAGERALSPSGRGLLLLAARRIESGEHCQTEKE